MTVLMGSGEMAEAVSSQGASVRTEGAALRKENRTGREGKASSVLPGGEDLPRIQRLCSHPLWRGQVRRIRELERDRIFCGHDVGHFLDVARIARIESLERGLSVPQEKIYAAALLHDIGRALEYEEGIPHQEGSVRLAGQILPECGYSPEETAELCEAIAAHRSAETGEQPDTLAGLLYRADKRSRLCLFCAAEPDCDWAEEKKNQALTV